MILLIDNYDSFSYNLYQMIGELNPDIKVIRNDEMTVDEIRALAPDGTADHYGRYTKEDDMLFFIPALFADQGMEELYAQYEAILAEAGVQMSRVRDTEDPLYRETMEEVRDTLR